VKTDRGCERIGRRPVAIAATLAAALVGGACADAADPPDAATGAEVGEFAATSEYLAGVAEATDGLAYRMSMDMTMDISAEGESLEMGGEFATGEVDGDLSSTTLDMGELFDDAGMPSGLLEGDLTMEMVTDGSTGYMRAPFFATMAEAALDQGATRDELGPLADLAALGDRWGRIDLSEVSPSQVATAAGGQSSDPRVFLDMAAQGSDVRDLGTETIDGVETRGLGATITYGDMIEAQGMDADDLREQMAAGAGGDEQFSEMFDQVIEGMFAMAMPVEVWVDGDDRVRRITLDLNMTELMAGIAEQSGEDIGDDGMSIKMVMDFTDYGDETIEIEIPADAVDITDEFLALQEQGGLGTAGSPVGST
jgi:hypothetical protein